MERGVCFASLATIAKDLNVSDQTIRRRLTTLCLDGYLNKLQAIAGKSNRFESTGKLKFRMGYEEQPTPTRESGVGDSESRGGYQRVRGTPSTESPESESLRKKKKKEEKRVLTKTEQYLSYLGEN